MNKLSWLIEISGISKIDQLHQKLRDLEKFTSTSKVTVASPAAVAAAGGGSLTVGGVAISKQIQDDMEKAARNLGYAGLAQGMKTDPRTFAGILSGLHPSLRF